MSLSIDSVMRDMDAMLDRSDHRPCKSCGDKRPESFGAYPSLCLNCRRTYENNRRQEKARQDRLDKAMEVLRVTNSFPPRRVS